MPHAVQPSHFLEDQIGPAHRSLIPTTLRQAYAAADIEAKASPILNVRSAKDQRGRFRTWSVDLAFQRLIDGGRWPFDYDWAEYDQPTGHYLRIRLPQSIMSISLVDCAKHPPRSVRFRENNALGNADYLFAEMNEERRITGLPSFVLAHGHTQPTFAHIGMAHPTRNRWLYRTPNLMKTPHAVASDVPPIEAEDEEAILELRERIERTVRDGSHD